MLALDVFLIEVVMIFHSSQSGWNPNLKIFQTVRAIAVKMVWSWIGTCNTWIGILKRRSFKKLPSQGSHHLDWRVSVFLVPLPIWGQNIMCHKIDILFLITIFHVPKPLLRLMVLFNISYLVFSVSVYGLIVCHFLT